MGRNFIDATRRRIGSTLLSMGSAAPDDDEKDTFGFTEESSWNGDLSAAPYHAQQDNAFRKNFAHTPPAATPSSYGNFMPKRTRAGSFSRTRSDSVESYALSTRLRTASELERSGLVTAAQKGVLKDMVLYGDEALRVALDKYAVGDSAELEKLLHAGYLNSGVVVKQEHECCVATKPRAASIDLLAELDLEGALSDLGATAPGGPRKPPPSAEVLSLPHDDQLMGFDMELPWHTGCQPGTYFGEPVDQLSAANLTAQSSSSAHHHHSSRGAAAGLPQIRGVLRRRSTSFGSYDSACSESNPHLYNSEEDRRRLMVRSGSLESEPSVNSLDGPGALDLGLCGGGLDARGFRSKLPGVDDGLFVAQAAAPEKKKKRNLKGNASPKKRGDDDRAKADSKHNAAQDAPVAAYDGKVSSTVQNPPCAADLAPGPAPPYEALINFPRAKTRALIHCVMCGRQPQEDHALKAASGALAVVIPRQNKDVCRECDKALWRHLQTETHFKWCKGCKRFRNLTAFAEKLAASKCDRCRERGRQGYMRRKGGAASPPGTPRHDDAGVDDGDDLPPPNSPGLLADLILDHDDSGHIPQTQG